jgi:hypothetical protein
MSEPAQVLEPPAGRAAAPNAQRPASHERGQGAVLDTQVREAGIDLAACFRAIAEAHGKPYQQLLLEIARAAFGPGRLTFHEYLALRLFDDAALSGADKRAFVGIEASRASGRRPTTTRSGGA